MNLKHFDRKAAAKRRRAAERAAMNRDFTTPDLRHRQRGKGKRIDRAPKQIAEQDTPT